MYKAIAACLCGLAAFSSSVQAQHAANATALTVTTGIDYSAGDYGTGSDTNILVVPLSARLSTGNWRITATLPYVRIEGADVFNGEGGPIVVDPNAPRTTRKGLGDMSLGVGYMIPEANLGIGLDLNARVKLPTSERAKRLGTGKTDVNISATASKTIGPMEPFVTAGYRFPGDPEGIDLRNAFYSSVGTSVNAGRAVVMAAYDYRQSASDFARDSHEAFGAVTLPLGQRLNLTGYGSVGLSKGAPDYGIGTMVSLKL